MGIYDANYYQLSANAMPPNKRLPKYLLWIFVLVSPFNWLRDVIFNVFKVGGGAYTPYSAGTYYKYERVIYEKGVYESKINSNTDLPTVTESWVKLTDNFIGIDERIRINIHKILIEYALNKWFFTTFRQPSFDGTSLSDIYITTNEVVTGFFRVGTTELTSTNIGTESSSEPIGGDGELTAQNNFTIWIPEAVYLALGDEKENIVKNFADKYIPIGLFYNIDTY